MFGNFLEETCTGTGTTITLAGATQYGIAFSNLYSNTDSVPYVIVDANGINRVGGVGTYNTGGTITRNDSWTWNGTTYDSSPAGNLTLTGGTHTIRVTPLASDFDAYAAKQNALAANQIIDWTVDQGATNIHPGNYINTTYVDSDWNHDNLTGFVANEHIDWTVDQGATNIHAGNYTNTTYVSSDFNHDDLTGFVANEHIDWTVDNVTNNVHINNIPDLSSLYQDTGNYVTYGTTSTPNSYLYWYRNSASDAALYVNNAGAGDIARFLNTTQGGTGTAGGAGGQFTVLNGGGFNAGGTCQMRNSIDLDFLNSTNADDGTRIYRASGNALRFAYTGNSCIFDAIADNTWQIRDSADATKFQVAPSTGNVTVYGDILPNSAAARDLGNSGAEFQLGYINSLYISDYIYHNDDVNTYMQFDAADNWRVVTGGAERLRVANHGVEIDADSGLIHNMGSNSHHVISPGGGNYRNWTVTITGAIEIAFPANVYADAEMLSWWVDIYDYTANESVTYFCAGYLYQVEGQNEWFNQTVIPIAANSNRKFKFRFGAEGSRHKVWIGELATTWSYMNVQIRNVCVHGSGVSPAADWADDFIISIESTAFGTVDDEITPVFPMASTAETLSGLTSTVTELNKLDGFTGGVTELNYLDALHATGVTSTEFDYLDGVTSNIQTQLNGKSSSNSDDSWLAQAETDLNLAYDTGAFYWSNTGSNLPVASSYGMGINIVSQSAWTHNNTNNWIFQLASTTTQQLWYREKTNADSWGTWERIFTDAYHPNADEWTAPISLTIGSTSKNVDGSGDVSWSLAEIGAQAAGNYITTSASQSSNIYMRNGSPTLYLRDTDGICAMLHNNSDLFYILRSDAVDDTGWTQYSTADDANGRWPLQMNLTNANHYFYIGSPNVQAGGNVVYHAGNFTAGVDYQAPLSNVAFTNVANSFSGTQVFTGAIDINTTSDSPLDMDVTDSGPVYISYRRAGTRIGWVGWGSAGTTMGITNEITNGSIDLVTNGSGTARYNGNEILSTGNFTAGSDYQAAGDYAVLNSTSTNSNDYLHIARNSTTNVPLYINQMATGDIARFINNATSSSTGTSGGTAGQFTVLNSGGIDVGGASNFRSEIDISTNTSNGITHTITDSAAENSFTGHLIDYNASGSTTFTGDKQHVALRIDVDSSATGGGETNEHLIYGQYNTVNATGDSHRVKGILTYAYGQTSSGFNGTVIGLESVGYDLTTGTGDVNSVYGGNFVAYGQGGASSTPNIYGIISNAQTQAANLANVNTMEGIRGQVTWTETANNFNVGSVYAVRARIDNNETGSNITHTGSKFLYYGAYEGTVPSSSWGIYLATDVPNYFRGEIRRYDDDSATIYQSRNTSASNAEQLRISHNFANVDIRNLRGTINFLSSVNFNDNIEARFGSGGDIAMFWDGSNFYTDFQVTNGLWYIRNLANTATFSIDASNGNVTMLGDLAIVGTVDGRDVATDGTKLDGIEAGAQVNVGTNLGNSASGTALTITSSTGNNTNLPAATTSAWGVMTDDDKTKLNGIAANANNYSHPNHTGHVTSTGDGATVLTNSAITGQTATTTIASTDEIILNDVSASNIRRADISVLQSYMQDNLAFTNNSGDITGVTAGNGLTGGGTSGSVTLTVGAGTGITVNASDIDVNYGTSSTTACVGNDARLSDARACNGTITVTSDATNANRRIPFTNSSDGTGSTTLYRDSTAGLYYNPSTNRLYAGSFQVISDGREKDIHGDYEGDTAKDIRTRRFDFKSETKPNNQIGYIAQEVLEVLPEAVSYDEEMDRYHVDMPMVHSAKIAELEARADKQDERIEELLDVIKYLVKRIN